MSENVLKTSEIVQENLLKYSSLAKRQIVHRHAVPAKLRSHNIKSAVTQLNKERINLKTNLNVALQKFKLRQDEKNKKDISKLHNQKLHLTTKLTKLRADVQRLNLELCSLELNNHLKKQKLHDFKLKSIDNDDIPADTEKILYKKTIRYNNELNKLRVLRQTLEDILKVKFLKSETYELIMNQLYHIRNVLTTTGESALKLQKERQQILQYLNILREVNKTEKKYISQNLYSTLYKFKINYEMSQFLRKKHSQRHVHKEQICQKTTENSENKKTNNELKKFMKFIGHGNEEIDLDKITENTATNEYQKESLIHLLIFVEQQLTKLADSIKCGREMSACIKNANYNRREMNRQQLKMKLDEHQRLTQTLKSSQEITEYLKNSFNELCEIIGNACQMLHIRLPTEKPTDENVLINEENIFDYVKEMAKKSYELIFKVNCIESNCLKEQDEDILTSDGESMQNLISKDYDGIEIKMRRLIRM